MHGGVIMERPAASAKANRSEMISGKVINGNNKGGADRLQDACESKRKPKATKQDKRRACARDTRNELLRLILYDLKGVTPLDELPVDPEPAASATTWWRNWSYCWAIVVLVIPSGQHRLTTLSRNGRPLQKPPIAAWPNCTAQAALEDLGFQRYAPDWPREAIGSGVDKARRRQRKTDSFLRADAMAKLLDVARFERDRLKLTHIGAVDFPKAVRDKARKERKRQRDRARAAQKRRDAKATPRAQYEAQSAEAVKPWLEFGMCRSSFYQLDKIERKQMLMEALRKNLNQDAQVRRPPVHCKDRATYLST